MQKVNSETSHKTHTSGSTPLTTTTRKPSTDACDLHTITNASPHRFPDHTTRQNKTTINLSDSSPGFLLSLSSTPLATPLNTDSCPTHQMATNLSGGMPQILPLMSFASMTTCSPMRYTPILHH